VSVTIWEYEKIRSKAVSILRNANPLGWIKRQPKHEAELQTELARIKKDMSALWNRLTPGEQVFAPIFVLNAVVFGLWRIPRLKLTMLKYFCSNPAGQAVCWPMFLSTFSHYSLFHLAANMYVLHSFSGAVNALGREQFVGLYLSAGVISSFASYAYKIAILQPGFSLGAVSFPFQSQPPLFIHILQFSQTVWSNYGDSRLRLPTIPRHKAADPLPSAMAVLGWQRNSIRHGTRLGRSHLQVAFLRSRCSFRWSSDWRILVLLRTTSFVASPRAHDWLLASTSRQTDKIEL